MQANSADRGGHPDRVYPTMIEGSPYPSDRDFPPSQPPALVLGWSSGLGWSCWAREGESSASVVNQGGFSTDLKHPDPHEQRLVCRHAPIQTVGFREVWMSLNEVDN